MPARTRGEDRGRRAARPGRGRGALAPDPPWCRARRRSRPPPAGDPMAAAASGASRPSATSAHARASGLHPRPSTARAARASSCSPRGTSVRTRSSSSCGARSTLKRSESSTPCRRCASASSWRPPGRREHRLGPRPGDLALRFLVPAQQLVRARHAPPPPRRPVPRSSRTCAQDRVPQAHERLVVGRRSRTRAPRGSAPRPARGHRGRGRSRRASRRSTRATRSRRSGGPARPLRRRPRARGRTRNRTPARVEA